MFKKKLDLWFFAVFITINYLALCDFPVKNEGKKSPIFISIGHACGTAGILKDRGLRKLSYPFDWIVSPYEALYKVFADDFNHFLERGSLKIRPGGSAILDGYGFAFVHDFFSNHAQQGEHEAGSSGLIASNYLEFYPSISSKYNRRIERLKKVLGGADKVIFVREGLMDKEQAIEFRDLIIHKYPELDFAMIVITYDKNLDFDWQQARIYNFFLKHHTEWRSSPLWRKTIRQAVNDLGCQLRLLPLQRHFLFDEHSKCRELH